MDTAQQKNDLKTGGYAIWCITPKGKIVGLKLKSAIKHSVLFVSDKIASDMDAKGAEDVFIFSQLNAEIKKNFSRYSGHIFIFSTGIAVRLIAPFLVSKLQDPCAVVVDDNANFAISLVSGHIGGGNALARQIADLTGALPVITTATDTNQLPAIDVIAKEKGLFIETPVNIKRINMAFLTGKPVHLDDSTGWLGKELEGLWADLGFPDDGAAETIFCSHEIKPVSRETLVLRPRILCVGIGCNRGTSLKTIFDFLCEVFESEKLSIKSISKFSTIDLKKDEKGLLALAKKMALPLEFYTREVLAKVSSIITPSKIVEKHVGVQSVSEACAILSSENGKLIVSKKKNKDVTISVAMGK